MATKTKANTGISEVVNRIPVGRDNAISRYDLRTSVGMDDRKVRDLIADARAEGYFILSTLRGYYIADTSDPGDIKEMQKFVRRESKRAISTFKGAKHMRAYLKLKGVGI